MYVPRLKELMDERDISMTGLSRKQEFIDALIKHDKKTRRKRTPTSTDEKPAKKVKKVKKEKPSGKNDRYKLEFTLDVGTSKWVISYVMTCKGVCVRLPQVPHIYTHGRTEVPMAVAWVDGVLMHGDKLEKWAVEHPEICDRIIDNFKMAFYPGPQTAEVRERIERMLEREGKTLDDVFAELLGQICADVKETIIRIENRGEKFSEEEIGEIFDRASWRLTVPQMWGPDARRRMQVAAKEAGMRHTVLASEAVCALAWWLVNEAEKKVTPEKKLGKGDVVLILDLGCGTVDFAMVELLEKLAANSKVATIGHSTGAVCGMGLADIYLLKTFLQRKGGAWFDLACQDLGFTENDLRRRILKAIEKVKNKFDPKTSKIERDTIYGKDGTHDRTIDITKAEYEAAMDIVISQVIKNLDGYVNRKMANVIVATGGGSRCSYLMDALIRHFKPQGIPVICPNEGLVSLNSPVAMGGCIRYESITAQRLPSLYMFAFVLAEEYDPEHHRDETPC